MVSDISNKWNAMIAGVGLSKKTLAGIFLANAANDLQLQQIDPAENPYWFTWNVPDRQARVRGWWTVPAACFFRVMPWYAHSEKESATFDLMMATIWHPREEIPWILWLLPCCWVVSLENSQQLLVLVIPSFDVCRSGCSVKQPMMSPQDHS